MAGLSAEQIAQRAFDLNLLDERQLQEVWGQFGRRNIPGDEFLQALLRREWMTNYQAERLLKGERTGFFYGDYKVLYRVATGSFARVYRAVRKDDGKVVALKVLRQRFSDDPSQTSQFLREGEMGCRLRHPNIVPIYEVVTDGRLTHFLVMEFIEGNNLREFVRVRKKLEPAEATRLITEITNGLNYAHQLGITHRDLKMTNVLVSSRGQAKLVDFGLADAHEKMDDETLLNHANPRTIDYAGLERATGVRKDDIRSDIYFMGCMYYNMLTGRPPLTETKDRIMRLSRQRFQEVIPIHVAAPETPRSVSLVVNKAMSFDPERRYQTPSEMLLELKRTIGRLQSAANKSADGDAQAQSDEPDPLELIPESQRPVLMFIESDIALQDIFRTGLKKVGYRVLLTSDPQRPQSRFEDNEKAAQCVIFSTGKLGRESLEAFNRFASHEKTQSVPAVLILGENQTAWKKEAALAEHRVALTMPIKLRHLREILGKLVPPTQAAKVS
jgi:serine/threonine-protein kinase